MSLFTFMFAFTVMFTLNDGAFASDLTQMLKTRSVGELEARTRAATARQLAHDMCSAELAARLLPRACFRELAMSQGTETKQRRLARLCIQNAKASRSRLDLSGPTQDLPPDCEAATVERLEDLQYRDEESSPETSVMRTRGPELEKTSD